MGQGENAGPMVRIAAVFSQLERKRLQERLRDAFAQKRSKGERMGRRERLSGEHAELALNLHRSGASLGAIRRELLSHGCSAPLYASTIARTIKRRLAAA